MIMHFHDFFSNTFDSRKVNNDDLVMDSLEATLAKMILTFKSPILSLPQMMDSIRIRELSDNEFFMRLIAKGYISTSVYGEVDSLKDYAITSLRNPEFTLSSMSDVIDSNNAMETRRVLAKKLNNDFAFYPSVYSSRHREMLDLFVEHIIKLNDVLGNRKRGILRINRNTQTVIYSYMQLCLSILQIGNMEDEKMRCVLNKLGQLPNNCTRSKYYEELDGIEDMDPITYREASGIIDLCYNLDMAPRVAEFRRISVDQSLLYAGKIVEALQERNNCVQCRKEDAIQNDLLRYYQEAIKIDTYGSSRAIEHANWEMVAFLVEVIESEKFDKLNSIPAFYRTCALASEISEVGLVLPDFPFLTSHNNSVTLSENSLGSNQYNVGERRSE